MNKQKILITIISLLFLSVVFAQAHPGPIDDSGGHYDSSTGKYHYHDDDSSAAEENVQPKVVDIVADNYTAYNFEDDEMPLARTAIIVTKVIAGDTIIVDNYGVEAAVCLLDLDIPGPGTMKGEFCRLYLQKLIEGRAVTLYHDDIRDEDGCLLSEVYFSTKNLSVHMQGFAESLPTQ